jgi:hypothetical protein
VSIRAKPTDHWTGDMSRSSEYAFLARMRRDYVHGTDLPEFDIRNILDLFTSHLSGSHALLRNRSCFGRKNPSLKRPYAYGSMM